MNKKFSIVGHFLFGLLLIAWISGLYIAPVDEAQGEVYRIIFLHVPSAFSAFFAS